MYAVIGDLVASRSTPQRAAVHRHVREVLEATNEALAPVQPLEQTVGDELQGGFASIGEATQATLLVRLGCLPVIDVRCGVGVGETTVFDDTRRPLLQDGPAWWAARAALDVLAQPRRSGQRTWYVDPDEPGDAGRINAYLLCRDQLVDRLGERAQRMLLAALQGRTQREIAEAEGISPSAVSQQFARGVSAVREAQELLTEG
ncbi:SatD family protein [Nocardioides massiliensis]|uniref:RNA polymerase subunit sigma-70 n=1 Tax=Nocardioides massiliensis TaxID=1325935 RepID=A0ABT9NN47_9ACTN|nr:SatD family protein [Nocardioides massiliensis]MDP9821846.1 hypothetical protein [Nocardioides massiliensis]